MAPAWECTLDRKKRSHDVKRVPEGHQGPDRSLELQLYFRPSCFVATQGTEAGSQVWLRLKSRHCGG